MKKTNRLSWLMFLLPLLGIATLVISLFLMKGPSGSYRSNGGYYFNFQESEQIILVSESDLGKKLALTEDGSLSYSTYSGRKNNEPFYTSNTKYTRLSGEDGNFVGSWIGRDGMRLVITEETISQYDEAASKKFEYSYLLVENQTLYAITNHNFYGTLKGHETSLNVSFVDPENQKNQIITVKTTSFAKTNGIFGTYVYQNDEVSYLFTINEDGSYSAVFATMESGFNSATSVILGASVAALALGEVVFLIMRLSTARIKKDYKVRRKNMASDIILLVASILAIAIGSVALCSSKFYGLPFSFTLFKAMGLSTSLLITSIALSVIFLGVLILFIINARSSKPLLDERKAVVAEKKEQKAEAKAILAVKKQETSDKKKAEDEEKARIKAEQTAKIKEEKRIENEAKAKEKQELDEKRRAKFKAAISKKTKAVRFFFASQKEKNTTRPYFIIIPSFLALLFLLFLLPCQRNEGFYVVLSVICLSSVFAILSAVIRAKAGLFFKIMSFILFAYLSLCNIDLLNSMDIYGPFLAVLSSAFSIMLLLLIALTIVWRKNAKRANRAHIICLGIALAFLMILTYFHPMNQFGVVLNPLTHNPYSRYKLFGDNVGAYLGFFIPHFFLILLSFPFLDFALTTPLTPYEVEKIKERKEKRRVDSTGDEVDDNMVKEMAYAMEAKDFEKAKAVQVELEKYEEEHHMKKPSYFDGGLLQLIGWRLLGGIITSITFGFAAPWAVVMIKKWEMKHTVINGKRLHFDGYGGQLFGKYIVWILLTFITFGIYSLWLAIKMKKWVVKHTLLCSNDEAKELEALEEELKQEKKNNNAIRVEELTKQIDAYRNSHKISGDSKFDSGLLGLIGHNILSILIIAFSFGIATPFAVCIKQSWETKHTIINGKRLTFKGKGTNLLGKFVLWILLSVVTFGIYLLWISIKMKKWVIKNTDFID